MANDPAHVHSRVPLTLFQRARILSGALYAPVSIISMATLDPDLTEQLRDCFSPEAEDLIRYALSQFPPGISKQQMAAHEKALRAAIFGCKTNDERRANREKGYEDALWLRRRILAYDAMLSGAPPATPEEEANEKVVDDVLSELMKHCSTGKEKDRLYNEMLLHPERLAKMLAERERLEQLHRDAEANGKPLPEGLMPLSTLEYELDGKTFRYDDLVVIVGLMKDTRWNNRLARICRPGTEKDATDGKNHAGRWKVQIMVKMPKDWTEYIFVRSLNLEAYDESKHQLTDAEHQDMLMFKAATKNKVAYHPAAGVVYDVSKP